MVGAGFILSKINENETRNHKITPRALPNVAILGGWGTCFCGLKVQGRGGI